VAFFYVPVSHDAKFQNNENITLLVCERLVNHIFPS
jgi:hypothetical protein